MEGYYFDILPLHPRPLPLESFTSYISRLCEANKLKTSEEIIRLLFDSGSIPSNDLKRLADFPLGTYGLLPMASGCSDESILSMTFFHLYRKFGRVCQDSRWNGFLKGAVAPNLRYCAYCLMNQEVPYYSLLWRFAGLLECPEHNYPLIDHCPHCGEGIPLFVYPAKIPFCGLCNKDLRVCCSPDRVQKENEQQLALSVEELKFLLSPHECELEKDIPLLLSQRLFYKAKVRSISIVHESLERVPRKLTRKNVKIDKQKETNIHMLRARRKRAIFNDYLNCTRYLGITLRDLFHREFFTTLSSDPEEKYKETIALTSRFRKLYD